jgi:hypothetical protein
MTSSARVVPDRVLFYVVFSDAYVAAATAFLRLMLTAADDILLQMLLALILRTQCSC